MTDAEAKKSGVKGAKAEVGDGAEKDIAEEAQKVKGAKVAACAGAAEEAKSRNKKRHAMPAPLYR